MILYLHGFRSSPQSTKARMMAAAMAERGLAHTWQCPQLPASPAASAQLALSLARDMIAQTPDAKPEHLTVIGSSLGGYYANWLAEATGCRAVLLNPVVHAARDLATQVGEHLSYYGNEPFVFLPSYVSELTELTAPVTQPERYFLLASTGDEVLDWREMTAHYTGCRQRIIPGSDHGISDFAHYLPEVLDFALSDGLHTPS